MSKNKKGIGGLILKTIPILILAVIIIFVSGHFSKLPKEITEKGLIVEVVPALVDKITQSPSDFTPIDWSTTRIWLLVSGILVFVVYAKLSLNSSTVSKRLNEEYGSASWITSKQKADFLKKYSNTPKEEIEARKTGNGNSILSQNYTMSNNTRKTQLNNNVLIIGGSGAGKSRGFVKPNVLQLNGSYIITDPAGELLYSTGNLLEKEGYKISVFNLVEFMKSDSYNPFAYIKKEEDVLKVLNVFIKNTDVEGSKTGDQFWVKAELMLLQALAYYLMERYAIKEGMTEEEIKFNKSKQNFIEVAKLLAKERAPDENELIPSELQQLMESLEAENPDSKAVFFYKEFRKAPEKTMSSILTTATSRMSILASSKSMENLLSVDTLELDKIADRKTALFIITPVSDDTYNFLAAMMYTQLFDTLYYKGDTEYGGGLLPLQVNFIMDEFANLGVIPGFTKKLATVRKYGINVKIILQSMAQIKTLYKDDWESITGNCDTLIYLGGNEFSTYEYISKRLGKQTISQTTTSKSFSKSNSTSRNNGLLGRELMTPDEVGKLENTKCIVLIRSLPPIIDLKYNYTQHPNYKLTGDYSKDFVFKNTKITSEQESLAKKPILCEVEVGRKRLSQFTPPQLRELESLFNSNNENDLRISNFYIKVDENHPINDISIYNTGFEEFIEKIKQQN